MNLPNKLTVGRLCMVPVFLVLMCVNLPFLSEPALRIIAAVIFILTSLTDMLDGKIARKYHLITDFGKFLVISALIGSLVNPYFEGLRPVFVWATVVVIFREFAVTSMRMIASSSAGLVIAAAWLGKVKTTTQMICIVTVLLEPVILPFKPFAEWHILSYVTIAAMTVMTLWSGIDYLKKYWKFIGATK